MIATTNTCFQLAPICPFRAGALAKLKTARLKMHITKGSALDFVPANHESPSSPAVLKKVLANHSQIQAGQIMMVNWAKLNPGRSFQPHFHEDMQEIFVMLEGTGEFDIDGTIHHLAAGDCAIVDPHETHSMHNSGVEPSLFLTIGVAKGEDGKTVMVNQ